MTEMGIFTGVPGGKFLPKEKASRAEMAVLHRVGASNCIYILDGIANIDKYTTTLTIELTLVLIPVNTGIID